MASVRARRFSKPVFYKGTFSAQNGTIVHSSLLSLFKPYKVPSTCSLSPLAGGLRPWGDFSDINSKTVLNSFPLPNLSHFTHKLKGSNTFSKVDLIKAFHQIFLDEVSMMKTTVKTPWGVYHAQTNFCPLSHISIHFCAFP